MVPVVAVQVTTQSIQYYNAKTNAEKAKMAAERSAAAALYAFEEPDTPLLPKIVRLPQFQGSLHYILGYQLFRHGHWNQAGVQFREALKDREFAAESDYLLAYMGTHDEFGCLDPKKDWGSATDILDLAVKTDPDYKAAFYLRVVLEFNMRPSSKPKALRDLKQAVEGDWGIAACYDITDEVEIKNVWTGLSTDPEFKQLQGCWDSVDVKIRPSSGSRDCLKHQQELNRRVGAVPAR